MPSIQLRALFVIAIVSNLLAHGTANCQPTWITWSFQMSNLEIIPSDPLPGEEVKVAFTIGTFQGASYENESCSIQGSDIQASVCMGIYLTADSETFQDTISLGTFTEGTYNLRLIARGDYGPTICDDFPTAYDSAYIDTSFFVSITNGIKTNQESNSIHLYPNPSTTHFFVDLPESNTILISVYDFSGRQIIAQTVISEYASQTYSISSESLDAGSYLLEIICDNRRCFEKFIKE